MRVRPLVVFLLFFAAAAAQAQLESDPAYGLSSDFRSWLSANGYSTYNFQRTDVPGGSYGGRVQAGQPLANQPVIFIHGNSDSALGTGSSLATGWRASIEYFKSQGYTSAELYATTWGPANSAFASQQYHSKDYLTRIRAFIQAVKAYTGATKVDIVTHSMGVTLARKAIKGGSGNDSLAGGAYNLGSSLTASVDTFVGIAGANRGLTTCYLSGPTTPTCGSTNGFYPGYLVGGTGPYGVSAFLVDLAATSHYEGTYVHTIWSSADEVIGYGTIVYGQSHLPHSRAERREDVQQLPVRPHRLEGSDAVLAVADGEVPRHELGPVERRGSARRYSLGGLKPAAPPRPRSHPAPPESSSDRRRSARAPCAAPRRSARAGSTTDARSPSRIRRAVISRTARAARRRGTSGR